MTTLERDEDVLNLCRSVPSFEPSGSFTSRTLSALRRDSGVVRTRLFIPSFWAVAVSTIFALLLAGWFFWGPASGIPVQPDEALVVSYVEDRKASLESFCEDPDDAAAFELFVDFWEYSRSRDSSVQAEKIRAHYSWMLDRLEILVG